MPGNILDGRFRIVGLIGRGGMGEVYRADDLKLDQTVALKFLPPGLEGDERRLNRFLDEVRSARQVTHPNVCRVYDIEEVEGEHFLSMEYIDGEDLSSLLRRIGRVPKERALEIARRLCAGIQAAHDQGILHRDLKPANVMIDGRGQVKITDFGLASLVDAVQTDEIGSGTPAYMAPEQLAGTEVTVRSDIYALGLVLFELFTGRRAFDVSTREEHAREQRDSAPVNPSSHVEGLDAAVEKTILRCLEREPRDRPDSAASVAAALSGGDVRAASFPPGGTLSSSRGTGAGTDGRIGSFSTNLPNPAGPLLGRDVEMAELIRLLGETRVATITGPGGVGKTRTAIELCRRSSAEFPDGILFASMAAVTDAGQFMPALAEALDVKEAAERGSSAGVASLIGEKRALLFLDNMEQVVSAAPDVAELVSRCAALKILVTSRTPLRIGHEREYTLDPLPVPGRDDWESLEILRHSPAVALFVESAQKVKPGFELTSDNAADVLAVCRRLDGLPLALELAAARIRFLSPKALLERLGHALDLLTAGARDRPERQQTLRATIDWSHSLLTDAEKRLFRRLSVFSGGCTIDGIEAVCRDGQSRVLDDLDSLVDKGLVRIGRLGDRILMLQTITEYAREQMEAAGEVEAVETRHARYFLGLALRIREGIEGDDQAGSIEQCVTEEANVRAVLDRSMRSAETGDGEACELGMQLCGHLWLYWHIRGKHVSAREYARSFLDAPTARGRSMGRCGALIAAGMAHWTLGQFGPANENWLESYSIAEELEAERELMVGAICLAVGHLGVDLERAFHWSEEGAERGGRQGNAWGRALALTFEGITRSVRGELQAAEMRYNEALALQRSIGDREGAGLSLGGLAQLASMRDDLTRSIELYEESLASFKAIGDRAEEARILGELAWTYLKREDSARARRHLLDAVTAYQDIASVRGVGLSLLGLAAAEVVEGRPQRAVQIASAAELFASREGIVNVYSEGLPGQEYMEKAKAALSAVEIEEAVAAGGRLTVKEAVDLATPR